MSSTKANIDDIVALYDALIATIPEIERKGKTIPYTSTNGYMFSLIGKEDGNVALRLSKDEREKFIKKYKTKIMEQYGKNMPEFVIVPVDLLKDLRVMKKYLKMSFEYTKSLKPK